MTIQELKKQLNDTLEALKKEKNKQHQNELMLISEYLAKKIEIESGEKLDLQTLDKNYIVE